MQIPNVGDIITVTRTGWPPRKARVTRVDVPESPSSTWSFTVHMHYEVDDDSTGVLMPQFLAASQDYCWSGDDEDEE